MVRYSREDALTDKEFVLILEGARKLEEPIDLLRDNGYRYQLFAAIKDLDGEENVGSFARLPDTTKNSRRLPKPFYTSSTNIHTAVAMPENDTPVTKDGDPDTTSSTQTRWKYTATILAGLMVVSLAVLMIGTAIGALTLSGISQAWFGLYFLVTMMAATWAFGKETLEAVNEARGRSEKDN